MKSALFLRSVIAAICLLALVTSPVKADMLAFCLDEVRATQSTAITKAFIAGNQVSLNLVTNQAEHPGCTFLDVDLARENILWARLINPSLLEADDSRIILQGLFADNTVNVSEIIIPTPPPPPRPVRAPPGSQSPAESTRQPVNYRSAWFWAPAQWLETPEQLWEVAARENLDRVYLTIEAIDGLVVNQEALAEFITRSKTRGLAVWAVMGDRGDVIEDNLPALLQRTTAYRQFNAQYPGANLDGLQLDIEPYLLPGFNLNQDFWRQRYISTITAVHATLEQRLALDLVMPIWWGNHPQWGDNLFTALDLPGLSVTVMNYRTDFERLSREALPFLELGQQQGTPVHMALVAGNLTNEKRKHYFPDATAGELWHLEAGDFQLLLLLDEVHGALPGRPYRLAFESDFNADTLTFAGDIAALNAIAARLVPVWSAWPAFAGIAIHGLDQAAAQAAQ